MSLNRVIVPFNKSFQNYSRRCLLYHSLFEQLKYIYFKSVNVIYLLNKIKSNSFASYT